MSTKRLLNMVIPLEHRKSSFRNLKLDDNTARGHWGSKAEFMLSCIGLSVGLGNLWRFPTLAYKNGGAAFFIPYIILQILVGKPLYFLELAIGQYAAQGPVGIFRINPGARGVGIAMVVVSTIIVVYYICIMAYTVYYAFACLNTKLPWSWCRKQWIQKCCYVRVGDGESMSKCGPNINQTGQLCKNDLCKCSGVKEFDFNLIAPGCSPRVQQIAGWNSTSYETLMDLAKVNCSSLQICTNKTYTPAHFYFYETVIQKTDQMDNIGAPLWQLSLCLLLAWIIVILCLLRGVRSSGKVVYFTATFPYVVILILLIKGATLTGARQGVEYFLVPDWSKLADIKVWKAAGGQMFFSLSIAFGPIITLGSYNKFRNNVYIDSLIISFCDIFTSFISGLVVFTTLGAIAHDTGLSMPDVAQSGYGLAFVAYPEALSVFPIPQFWSFLFFVMLFTLGVDSQFGYLETIITCIVDDFPRLVKYKLHMTIGSGVICFFIALSMTTPGGDHVLTLLDSYGATDAVYVICFGEITSIIWVYGAGNFLIDIEYMLGYKPHPEWYWRITWTFVAPIVVAVIFIISLAFYEPPELVEGTPFPVWAQVLGWFIFLAVVCPIPLTFAYGVYHAQGNTLLEKIKYVSTPSEEWQPQKHGTWKNSLSRICQIQPIEATDENFSLDTVTEKQNFAVDSSCT